MTKYIVKEKFVDSIGSSWFENDKFDETNKYVAPMIGGLLLLGFIKEIKDTRWLPKIGETYYTTNGDCESYPLVRVSSESLGDYYENNNNIYRSRETAELVATFLKEAFNQLHNPEEKNYLTPNYINLFDEARKAVLADDKGEE